MMMISKKMKIRTIDRKILQDLSQVQMKTKIENYPSVIYLKHRFIKATQSSLMPLLSIQVVNSGLYIGLYRY